MTKVNLPQYYDNSIQRFIPTDRHLPAKIKNAIEKRPNKSDLRYTAYKDGFLVNVGTHTKYVGNSLDQVKITNIIDDLYAKNSSNSKQGIYKKITSFAERCTKNIVELANFAKKYFKIIK